MSKAKRKDTTSRLVTQSTRTAKTGTEKGQNTVEVLYQKMGDRWFAFSVIEDEVFVGSIPQSELTSQDPSGRKIRSS